MRAVIFQFGVVGLLACGPLGAQPAPWPKPVEVKVEWVATAPERLPTGVSFEQLSVEDRDPHEVDICWLDLNQDGTPELIIDSREGGTGGSVKFIFARTPTGMRQIARWMGGINLVDRANGFYQLESWSSGGGGKFSRMLFRHEDGRYRMVRLEDWRATEGADGFQFVGSRDPKQFDHE